MHLANEVGRNVHVDICLELLFPSAFVVCTKSLDIPLLRSVLVGSPGWTQLYDTRLDSASS